MASFDIHDSIKSYFNDRRIQGAVDALIEGLDGTSQPEMDWNEAREYNQSLLMAAQLRADYTELLFNLWDTTFGAALSTPKRKFKVDFEWDNCTPEFIWENKTVWCSLSRHGLQSDASESVYELKVCQEDELILLSVVKWDKKKARYKNFEFDPSNVGTGNRWHSSPDEDGDVVGNSTKVDLATFLAQPDQELLELQAAAREMVDYLSQIV